MSQSDDDSVLAGEYALGVLSWEDRLAFEARLKRDAALRDHVDFWQNQFAPLSLAVPPMAAPATLERIQVSLFGAPPAPTTLMGWLSRLTTRQVVMLLMIALALCMAIAVKITALLHFMR